ncbi:hypothetical protein OG21DRAFT_1510689 [Imleria badia]|nr:hypothetical protein OG21DRAFT_1510689 [Imleria badia]
MPYIHRGSRSSKFGNFGPGSLFGCQCFGSIIRAPTRFPSRMKIEQILGQVLGKSGMDGNFYVRYPTISSLNA